MDSGSEEKRRRKRGKYLEKKNIWSVEPQTSGEGKAGKLKIFVMRRKRKKEKENESRY